MPIEAGGPFRWLAQPGLESVARRLAENRELLRPLPGIGPVGAALALGREEPEPAERPAVYLLRDLDCLEPLGLTGIQPDWVSGVASLHGGFIALRADPSGADMATLPATFRHEVAHLALHAATAGNAPRWLQEGYAQYAAGSWDWQSAWRLRLVLLTRGDEVLRDLRLGFPAHQEGARVAYMLSYTGVQELASLGGPQALASLFARLREGASLDVALRRTFGLTEDQFEERWRNHVGDRYGILYILSRATVFWVAVTMILLWFGWRRRKRDREKMKRLKEQERAEGERGEPVWHATPLFVLRHGERPGGPDAIPEDEGP